MSATYTAEVVLGLLAREPGATDEVLRGLDAGMWDEWDCGLEDGIANGFGGPELDLAARTGAGMLAWERQHADLDNAP